MLATEPTTAHPLLEMWAQNEPMRHIPTPQWMIAKIDGDLRRRLEILHRSTASLPADDPRRHELEEAFRAICGALDRLAEIARHSRPNPHPPSDIGQRLSGAIAHTVSCLQTLDTNTFGRRFPVQTHERSKAEPLYAALLTVIDRVHRLTERVRAADPSVDERLLEGLVVLGNPVDARMLQPIA